MGTGYRSVLELLRANAQNAPEKTAALVKRKGAYQSVSWLEVWNQSQALAAGLIGLGVQPGDRVALLGNTSLEWVVGDMGILGAGAATVAIYPTNLADECQFICEDSGAVVVIAEDESQTEKFLSERSRLPGVRKVVQIQGTPPTPSDWVITWDALMSLGEAHRDQLDARLDTLSPESILTINYTSGTTGRPKGAVTTHAAMLWEAQSIVSVDVVRTTDVQLLFLPLAHSFAKMLEIAWIATRHVLAFAESIDKVRDNLLEVRPTVMAGVPRFFEKLHAAIVQKAVAEGGVKRVLFERASALSAKRGRMQREGMRLSWAEEAQYRALKATVFRKVGQKLGEALGGRMRAMGSGGAPISRSLLHFFRDAGLLVLEGYGLTETAAAAFINQPGKDRIGTVGQILPGMEVQIAPDGEILLRGPNIFREYWNQPEETARVLKNGWLYTGDIGKLDADGYLIITDRKKDLIITAGGKNIAPQTIENMIKGHELISQVVVHGDRRQYLTAVITLDPDALRAFCEEHSLGTGAYAIMSQKPEVEHEVRAIVERYNKQLPPFATIKKFRILEHDFTQESGELTPTLKVKRRVINERYRTVFDGFYGKPA